MEIVTRFLRRSSAGGVIQPFRFFSVFVYVVYNNASADTKTLGHVFSCPFFLCSAAGSYTAAAAVSIIRRSGLKEGERGKRRNRHHCSGVPTIRPINKVDKGGSEKISPLLDGPGSLTIGSDIVYCRVSVVSVYRIPGIP